MELRFLLLLLCISGFEAQEFDAVVSRAEGQRLIVECHYNYWDYSATPKTWCQLRDEKCFPLVSTSYTSDRYQNKVTSGRATIEDDTGNAIVTITMEKLQVQDSGVYWCARYYLPSTMYPLKTIKLDVSKEYDAIEGQSLSVQCPYNIQDYKGVKKAWCRSTVQKGCDVLVNTGHRSYRYQNWAQKGRARIHDDTQTGIVTITMENLQADDAGVYWCAYYKPPRLYRIIEVKLAVTKALLSLRSVFFFCAQSQGFSNVYDPKDNKQEMPQDLKYATLAFKSRPSPRESVYANITPSRALEIPHTRSPTEPVEYASISLKPLASGAKS
uniref:Ig-like domain-containing protein n=1 Tax=Chelonoidis abingdonii TaxID=106734 RepID=A0A8C0GUM0_CHEAB